MWFGNSMGEYFASDGCEIIRFFSEESAKTWAREHEMLDEFESFYKLCEG